MSIYQLYNIVKTALFTEQEQDQTKEMTFISRINRLSLLLSESVYQKKYQDNICLFYSSLITQYPHAKATKIRPNFLYQPPIYTPLISFNLCLAVRVQTKRINCDLDLSIMFPPDLSHQMPHFYLKNPNYQFFKPSKYTQIAALSQGCKYQAIFGGLRVILPCQLNQVWKWTPSLYYVQQNVVNIVRFIHKKILPEFFPFAKRVVQKNNTINQKANFVKQFLQQKMLLPNSSEFEQIPFMQNIQSAHTLRIAIQKELQILQTQIASLKQIAEKSQVLDIVNLLAFAHDRQSQEILDTVSSMEALKDTQAFLQHKFVKGQINFDQFKTLISRTSHQKFNSIILLQKLQNLP